jgi:hypothetical protein
MPYYVFRISPERKLTLLNSFDKFKEAMTLCRNMRREQPPTDKDSIRMTFAKTEAEAKRLLSEKRQAASPLEEWEA